MKWNILFVLTCLSLGLHAQIKNIVEPSLTIYDNFDDFSHLLEQQNDTTYVVNFWATWCKPCVAELPYFQEISLAYQDKPVKVILVSLDFKRQIEKKLKPFLKKHQLHPEVVLLNDGNTTRWIDLVSPEWSGAIPATYFYKNDNHLFIEGEFESKEEIEEYILKISKS